MAINPPISPNLSDDLKRFQAAQDLDDLRAAREKITVITRADAGVLAEIVTAATDDQAVANLLMYPEVIPAQLRVPTVLAALQRSPSDYRLLAAIVGLGRLELDEADQKPVAGRLLELSARADEPVSSLASRAFSYVAGGYDVQLTVEHLGKLRPTERHNVLAALVNQFGTGRIYKALAAADALGLMSPDDVQAIRGQLEREEHDPFSNLRITLLTYIPNLKEWRPNEG
jgi:hypothetical protein